MCLLFNISKLFLILAKVFFNKLTITYFRLPTLDWITLSSLPTPPLPLPIPTSPLQTLVQSATWRGEPCEAFIAPL
jgi:hypothetical protein